MAENSLKLDNMQRFESQSAEATKTLEAQHSTSTDELAMLYCPVCSQRLQGHRCKLVCAHCGYYMSCADYY